MITYKTKIVATKVDMLRRVIRSGRSSCRQRLCRTAHLLFLGLQEGVDGATSDGDGCTDSGLLRDGVLCKDAVQLDCEYMSNSDEKYNTAKSGPTFPSNDVHHYQWRKKQITVEQKICKLQLDQASCR